MALTLAITGSTGLVGSSLIPALRAAGHQVYPLRRETPRAGEGLWNPGTGQIETPTPVQVIIHLAGKNIATRWTLKAKQEIAESRGPSTQRLVQFLAAMPASERPGLFISASAIGIYGHRGDELLTEDAPLAPHGASFLSDVCLAWEAATKPAEDAGIRVIHPRIGIVLAKEGGALAKMLTPAKLGLLGPVGKGTQWMPWISLTDLVRMLAMLAESENIRGPINAVGPQPVQQHVFARTLAGIWHRPAIFPMPAPMVRMLLGQMGTEMLLTSMRVTQTRLGAAFTYTHQTLEAAIRAEMKVPGTGLTPHE